MQSLTQLIRTRLSRSFQLIRARGLHCPEGMVTDFLMARPSFLSGLARLFDVGATFDSYNRSRTPFEADLRATYADWRMVGEDVSRALSSWAELHPMQVKLAEARDNAGTACDNEHVEALQAQ